jgi:DNA topoisomerase I
MTKPLIVVESPAKVRTIKKYVGKNFNVAATVGHIKDLPRKEMGVDIENKFKPKYETIKGKSKIISSLKNAAGDAMDIYLAPDPDREGEAIAWHTAGVLKKKDRKFHRVLFHELTKSGILKALKSPDPLDKYKYDAQQARRILDRLVGYQISPLLWKKVKGRLSAGRVQSVAVRIICDRERAIYAFVTEEYWSITSLLKGENPPEFNAKLVKKKNKKLLIKNEKSANNILEYLNKEDFIVDKIIKKTVKRNPLPPFITSKLQQESIQKLRFSAKKTMMIAQQLYEGIDLGPNETAGLITYMRTDSTRIAYEAAVEAMQYINEKFGKDFSLNKPRFFKNKNKAQDAHEAIRPTSVFNTPEKVKPYLSDEQFRLYSLIWKRFVASQMQQALIDQNSIAIKAGDYTFTAAGSTVKFLGFMALYTSFEDNMKKNKKEAKLPNLSQGMKLDVLKLDKKQHFTAPPPRFSEASLVKELEENGIGRPSTYAAILSTIRDKGYVDFLKGYFRPTELGFIVNDLLVKNFPEVLGVDFTAKMENNLDNVEAAKEDFVNLLDNFYSPFSKALDQAGDNMISMRAKGFVTELKCPDCNAVMNIKMSKHGPFLSCSAYPECKYARNYKRDENGNVIPIEPAKPPENSDKTCDKCGEPMVVKSGRYGEFWACTGYPKCKNTESLTGKASLKTIGVKCPQTKCDGEVIERKTKRGKIFYGCSKFPKCTFASWEKPA